MSHTPGPWAATYTTIHTVTPEGSLRVAITDTEYTSDAVTSREMAEANARLIAQAPTLAAENARLREALEWIEYHADVAECRGVIAKARAALAGEGGTP